MERREEGERHPERLRDMRERVTQRDRERKDRERDI